MKVLDLFSGTGGWSRAFSEAGDEVFTIDLDPRFERTSGFDIESTMVSAR